MSIPYVVLCQYDEPYDAYGLFLHEADLLLMELGNAVRAGTMTVEQAKEMWAPYRELFPELYEPGYAGGFPTVDLEVDSLPASQRFNEEVQRLEIPRAGYVSPRGGSGPVLTVRGQEALDAVRERLHDRYRIVVLDGNEPKEYWRGGPEGTLRVIAWARERAGLAG
jgi:hypothetical protein